MAKKFRRMFAMVMVMCLLATAGPLQALAAEDGVTVETVDGVTVTTTTTTTETPSGDGNTTVTVTIEKVTEGTEESTGEKVTGTETTTTTTVKDANGEVRQESWEVDGEEKREWTEEDTGDEPGQPEVEVKLESGETTTGTASSTETTGDPNSPEGETATTTTDRTVTAETSDVKVTVNESDTGLVEDKEAVLTGPAPVYDDEDLPKSDAAGKDGLFDRNHLSSQTMDRLQIGDVTIWINDSSKTITNIHIPEGAELPEGFSYEIGQNVSGWFSGSNLASKQVPAGATIANNVAINNLNNWHQNGELIVDVPEGADFMYVGTGEHSKYYAAYVNVVYKEDEDGNPVLDEEGNPIIEKLVTSSGTVVMVNGEPATDMEIADLYSVYNGSRATNFMLMDKNGNRVYAYCCDLQTGTAEGVWYSVSNLEDSEYYASEESEKHIRSIALNGYWGTSDVPKEDGTYQMGSLEGIKAKLKAAIEAGEIPQEYETYLYSECVNGTCGGTCSSSKECTGGKLQRDENGNPIVVKYDMLALLDGLTEGEALLATQAAIWSFSNGHQNALNGVNGPVVVDPSSRSNFKGTKNEHEPLDNEGNARAEFLYNWLVSLDTEEDPVVVINDKNFVEDISLTVGDKVADHEFNQDANQDNDVYNTDLNFKLAFIPGDNDDLLVQITYTDLDGNPVNVVRRLAGENAEGQNYEDIRPEADGSYVLRGLKLSENEDFNFDLRLEGTQYLEQGVYVYAPVGGRDVSQTFVGVAEGEKNVDISVGVTVSFDVDENNHVVAERKWHDQGDPIYPPADNPAPQNDEPEVPTIYRLNRPDAEVEEIPEEPVPLAAPVVTGDDSGLWIAVIMMAAFALVAFNLFEKKYHI